MSHGLFVEIRDLADHEEWLRELRAWQQVVPRSAVFTGLTAARLAGWWMPRMPEWVPVFMAVDASEPRPQRVGLVVSEFKRAPGHRPWLVQGLPADRPSEILLRCARDLGLLDLVILVDSALRSGAVTREELVEASSLRRPGVRLLRQALDLARPASESPWETILRNCLVTMGLDLEVQPEIRDGRGGFVSRVDLRIRGTMLIYEYDGDTHRSPAAHQDDLRRERNILATGHERRGYTASDIVVHPAVLMSEIDRTLGRPSDVRRLRAWRKLLERSTLTRAGRDRLRNRWAVPMGAFIAD